MNGTKPAARRTFGRSNALAILAALYLGWLPCASAGENAALPYKDLDRMWQIVSAANPTNLIARLQVLSTNPAVPASDLKLTVQSVSRGNVPIELATNGVIRSFPQSRELSKEGPTVMSNQPKGSLHLIFVWGIPVPAGLTFRYSKLRAGVAEVNRMIKTQAGLAGLLSPWVPKVPKAGGVLIQFPASSAGKAKVEIRWPTGSRAYTADPWGRVLIKLEPRVPDDAEVTVSEKIESLVPRME